MLHYTYMDTPLHILVITPFLSSYGLEQQLGLLIRNSDPAQTRYTIVYFENKLGTGASTDQLQQQFGATTQFVHVPRQSGGSVWTVGRDLGKQLTELQPDVVLAKEWFPSIVAVLARTHSSWHGPIIASAEMNPSFAFVEQLRSERLSALKLWVYKRLYRQVDAVAATSLGVQQAVVEVFGVTPTHIHHIPNGVDTTALRDMTTTTSQDNATLQTWLDAKPSPLFVSVGRLEREKGYDVLLQAFAKAWQGTAARLIILGEGSLRKELEDLAAQLAITNQIFLPGFVDRPAAVVAHATAFLFTSRWEGFGLAVAEALAVGTPVIATRYQYGAEELLIDSAGQPAGWLVAVDDVAGLATAMQIVVNDTAAANVRAQRGQAHIQAHFTVQQMADRYHKLFRSVQK